jgi:hypothetical protein
MPIENHYLYGSNEGSVPTANHMLAVVASYLRIGGGRQVKSRGVMVYDESAALSSSGFRGSLLNARVTLEAFCVGERLDYP